VNERDRVGHGGELHADDEERVRELLERAGTPTPIPREELEAITAVARSAWRASWAAPKRRPSNPGRYWALAATLTVAVGAVAWWGWLRGEPGATVVARVEAVRGTVLAREPGRDWHALSVQDGLPARTWLQSEASELGAEGETATAAFRMADEIPGIDLPAAVATVSGNPARAVGLADRGEIAPGKRADLIRVRRAGDMPVVRTAWRAGMRVA